MCWNHGDGGLVLEKGEMWVFYRTQCSICKDLNVLPTLLNHFNILWPAEKLDNILSHLAVNENYNLFHYANPGMKQLSGWLVSQESISFTAVLWHTSLVKTFCYFHLSELSCLCTVPWCAVTQLLVGAEEHQVPALFVMCTMWSAGEELFAFSLVEAVSCSHSSQARGDGLNSRVWVWRFCCLQFISSSSEAWDCPVLVVWSRDLLGHSWRVLSTKIILL